MEFDIDSCVRVVRVSGPEEKYESYSWCETHKRRLEFCNDEHNSQVILGHAVDSLVELLEEIRSEFTPAIRRRLLDAMAIESCRTDFNHDNQLWCFAHNEPAIHCAPNGDDACCETYAKNEGCSCCKGNQVY